MTVLADALEAARSVRIEHELERRGVKLRGRADRCGPCPQCGGDDRFSIHIGDQVFNCRICGAKGHGAIDLVMFLDGSGFKEAVATLCGREPKYPAHHARPAPAAALSPARLDRSDDVNRKRTGDIWRASADPRGTLVHVYLENRKLDLPDECAGEVIRFHPDCPMRGEHYPAMICLVRSIASNEPQAIVRTALTPEGRAIKRPDKEGRLRTFRMSLGPTGGGAIKIDADEHVTQGLCVGEGVETCLAGRQMGLRPVWALLGTAGVEKFPVLPSVNGLHVFRENDANLAGPKACEACAARWRAAGREVIFADPGLGSDLADEAAS
jgi:hypothetical protein